MPTLLTHILVKPEAIPRWEKILADLVARTEADEPERLRYEYWRGDKPGAYYALLSYPTAYAFYRHQGSETHDKYLDDFTKMFADIRFEWIDPVARGGSGLPATENDPLPPEAPEKIRAQVGLYPILISEWWKAARKTS